MDPIYFRGIERLLIILAGILAITFGYFLFSKSLSQEGEVIAKNGKLSLILRGIGQGVFFALFGMVIVVNSALNPFERSIQTIGDADSKRLESVSGYSENTKFATGGLPPDKWEKKATVGMSAVNKAIKYLKSPPIDAVEANELQSAIAELTDFRRTLIDQTYSDGSFDKYQLMRTEINESSKSMSDYPENEQKEYEKIKSMLEG